VPFFAGGGRGVPLVGGLGTGDLARVLCVLATLAACSSAAFAPNCLACVNAAFSHARDHTDQI
jgi:hypothetical protein